MGTSKELPLIEEHLIRAFKELVLLESLLPLKFNLQSGIFHFLLEGFSFLDFSKAIVYLSQYMSHEDKIHSINARLITK
jgi:hypothetical protein